MELHVVIGDLVGAADERDHAAVRLTATGRRVAGLDAGALGPRLAPVLAELLDAAALAVAEQAARATVHAAGLRATAEDFAATDTQVAADLRRLLDVLGPGPGGAGP